MPRAGPVEVHACCFRCSKPFQTMPHPAVREGVCLINAEGVNPTVVFVYTMYESRLAHIKKRLPFK
jgi:hypothetical protein